MTKCLSQWMILTAIAIVIVVGGSTALGEEEISPAGEPGKAPEVEAPAEVQETDPKVADPEPAVDDVPPDEQPVAPPAREPGADGFRMLLPLLVAGVILMWILGSRKSRKADKERKEMLGNIKKGDKVTSIGGIVGTAVDVREHEVTVKVDETSNTRLKLARWAIRSVGAPADEKDQESK